MPFETTTSTFNIASGHVIMQCTKLYCNSQCYIAFQLNMSLRRITRCSVICFRRNSIIWHNVVQTNKFEEIHTSIRKKIQDKREKIKHLAMTNGLRDFLTSSASSAAIPLSHLVLTHRMHSNGSSEADRQKY